MYAPPQWDNSFPRTSGRTISVPLRGMTKIVIEGHGEHVAPYAHFAVPDCVEIVVYQGYGVGLDNSHGKTIAKNGSLPSRLPTLWDGQSGEYDTEKASKGGAVRTSSGGLQTFYGGLPCPNYTLYAPNEPGFSPFNIHPASFAASPGKPMSLQQIAELFRGHDVQLHWACCTVRR